MSDHEVVIPLAQGEENMPEYIVACGVCKTKEAVENCMSCKQPTCLHCDCHQRPENPPRPRTSISGKKPSMPEYMVPCTICERKQAWTNCMSCSKAICLLCNKPYWMRSAVNTDSTSGEWKLSDRCLHCSNTNTEPRKESQHCCIL